MTMDTILLLIGMGASLGLLFPSAIVYVHMKYREQRDSDWLRGYEAADKTWRSNDELAQK